MKPIFVFCNCILIKTKQSLNGFDCFQLGNSSPVFYIWHFCWRKKLTETLCNLICNVFPIKAIITYCSSNILRIVKIIDRLVVPVMAKLIICISVLKCVIKLDKIVTGWCDECSLFIRPVTYKAYRLMAATTVCSIYTWLFWMCFITWNTT